MFLIILGGCPRWGKGGIPKVVPPLLPKGTLEVPRRRFSIQPGEHSTALVSVFLCVFFWVGTIWGKGGIPQVVPPLLLTGTLGANMEHFPLPPLPPRENTPQHW